MRAVNLLPRDEKRARLEGTRTPLLVVAGGVAAVTTAAVLLVVSTSGTADQRRAELAEVEAATVRLPKEPDPAVSQDALLQERTNRIAALSAALSTRVSFDRLLREISLVLPEDAWLTGFRAATSASLSTTTGSPGTPTPPPSSSGLDGVTMQGATYSHDSVARVFARLTTVPSLENIRLTASARVELQPAQSSAAGGQTAKSTKKSKQKAVVTFTITASLRTGDSP